MKGLCCLSDCEGRLKISRIVSLDVNQRRERGEFAKLSSDLLLDVINSDCLFVHIQLVVLLLLFRANRKTKQWFLKKNTGTKVCNGTMVYYDNVLIV